MDKEHRFGALTDLGYLLSLSKRPAILVLAERGSGVHQWEGRQAKLVFELSCELVPYTGITAILHKALHIFRSLLTRYSHRSSCTHRYAMNHLPRILHSSFFTLHFKYLMGYLRPSDDVPSVFPPHLYMTALTLAMSIQIGKEHIIPHIMIVEIGDVEHTLSTYLVAMNHNGGSVGRLGGIEIKRMSLVAGRHQQKGVFHTMMLIHRVHPG